METGFHQEIGLVNQLKQCLYRVGGNELGRRLVQAAASYRSNLPVGLLTNYYDQPPHLIADKIEQFGQRLSASNIPTCGNDSEELDLLDVAFQNAWSRFMEVVVPALNIIDDAHSHLGCSLDFRTDFLHQGDEDLRGIPAKARSYYVLQKLESCREHMILSSYVDHLKELPNAIHLDLEQIAIFFGVRSGVSLANVRILRPKLFRDAAERLLRYPHLENELCTIIQILIDAGQAIMDAYAKQEGEKKRIQDTLDTIASDLWFDIYRLSHFANEHGVIPPLAP